jgi:acetyltransferase-like isoleucine patch superfamily enzyme
MTPFWAIHPSAIWGWVSGWGEGVLRAGVTIFTNMKLGRHVHVNPNATIGHDSVLSDFVSVNPAAIISGGVSIEAETLIGASATTLQQRSVGADTVVGAGSVVTKHLPSGVAVMGVPGAWQ